MTATNRSATDASAAAPKVDRSAVAPASYVPNPNWHMDDAAAVQTLLADGGSFGRPGVAAHTHGIRGNCLVFNGTSGCVEINDIPALNLSSEATIAAWIKLHARPGDKRQVIAAKAKKGGTTWSVYAFSATPATGLNQQIGIELERDSKLCEHHTSGPTITHGLWYHAAVTVGDDTLCVFVDGVKVLEQDQPGPFGSLGPNEGRLSLGNDPTGASPFNGAIDEIVIFSRALTAQELAGLYREQLGEERRKRIRQTFLADFPNVRRLTHYVLPGSPERPKDTASRAAFLASYPNFPPDAHAARRPWTAYLQPPFWYGKAWSSRDANQRQVRSAAIVNIVAAADSTAADKADAHYVCDGSDDDIEIQAARFSSTCFTMRWGDVLVNTRRRKPKSKPADLILGKVCRRVGRRS